MSSQFSAVSLVEALAASVPPWASTTFEFKIPVAGLGRMYGKPGLGAADVMTTVSGPSAVIVSPASRNAGLPLRLISRSSDHTTSAEVTGVPSENLALGLRWKTYFRAPFRTWYEVARSGTTFLKLPP